MNLIYYSRFADKDEIKDRFQHIKNAFQALLEGIFLCLF